MAKQATSKVLEIWQSKHYYACAKKGSSQINHYGMQILYSLSENANTILDLGCGEGTRLNYIARGHNATGVDISTQAISTARKHYPKLTFKVANLEKLPFKDSQYDLTYSAFVLEHTINPERILEEAIRVTQSNGYIVLIAPNFGSPNRASPLYKKSRLIKLLKGFTTDIMARLVATKALNWERVEPITEIKDYKPDYDTTIEPYSLSLINFLKAHKLQIITVSTCWEEEMPNARFQQKFFRLLGKLTIYPFTYWGPHIVVVAQKSAFLK